MIFVTVGTSRCDFSRLIKAVDDIAPEFEEEFVVQIGHTTYKPRNIKNVYTFLSMYEFDKLVSTSKLIISHAGIGSILTAIQYNKPIIVVPRLTKYNETTTDHQLDVLNIIKKLGIRDQVRILLDTSLLERTIKEVLHNTSLNSNASSIKSKKSETLRKALIMDIKKFIIQNCYME